MRRGFDELDTLAEAAILGAIVARKETKERNIARTYVGGGGDVDGVDRLGPHTRHYGLAGELRQRWR